MRKVSLLFATAAPGVILNGVAYAQNIVQYPGFELADPGVTGPAGDACFAPNDIGDGVWFVTRNDIDVDVNNEFVFNGAKSAFLTPDNITSSLTQTLTTTPG